MKRIFYGVCGEGLGHATRTISLIEQLKAEVHVFTFGKAYDFFRNMGYRHLHKIEGIMFSYKNGKVNYLRTGLNVISYYRKLLQQNIDDICNQAVRYGPDLFITDFEPSICHAAREWNVSLVSVDNQHRFCCCGLRGLPARLKTYSWITGKFVKRFIPNPDHVIISTFHYDLERACEDVTLVNGMIRQDLANKQTSDQGFTLVYTRDSVTDRIINSVFDTNQLVKIYGAREDMRVEHPRHHLRYYELSPNFVDDLANCSRLICTAGNQLISEARFLGKPVLALPEPGQYEQSVNGYFVEKLGMGMTCPVKHLSQNVVSRFMTFKPELSQRPNGAVEAAQAIGDLL